MFRVTQKVQFGGDIVADNEEDAVERVIFDLNESTHHQSSEDLFDVEFLAEVCENCEFTKCEGGCK